MMEHSEEFKKAMKAVVLGEPNSGELIKQLPAGSDEVWTAFAVAMLSGLLEKVFKQDSSPEAVKRFTDQVRYAYRNAEPPIKTLALEALVRGLLGEDHFLDELSPEDQYTTELLVIRYVGETDEHVKAHVDSYLTDAVTLTEELLSDDDE